MKLHWPGPDKLPLLILASLMWQDVCLTFWGLSKGGIELNPVVAWALSSGGLVPDFLILLTGKVLALVILHRAQAWYPLLGRWGLNVALVVYGLLIPFLWYQYVTTMFMG